MLLGVPLRRFSVWRFKVLQGAFDLSEHIIFSLPLSVMCIWQLVYKKVEKSTTFIYANIPLSLSNNTTLNLFVIEPQLLHHYHAERTEYATETVTKPLNMDKTS